MSELLKTIAFEKIIELCIEDYYTKGKIFEIDEKYFYRENSGNVLLGPAAGPHTQLAQNILTAYLTGARYFELKTVQIIDGKQMQDMIPRPCIDAKNVGYNVEWSTELTIQEATEEYIKASILLQVFGKELGLSETKDFVINASVGYNLEGIQSEKISNFIDDLNEAKDTKIFKECIEILKKNIGKFRRFKLEDIDRISSTIINSVTLSTMHGCKAEEIFDIASYLMKNKGVNLYIKCNSTLLGYDNVREVLDGLGYDDIVIRRGDFDSDLQFDNAVDIISKLMKLSQQYGLFFGVKLTNTLPVYNARDILSGESVYLSGKPLYPIALGVAKMLGKAFDGNIHISFSGGIDKNNAVDVLKTGIHPITFSTILLKPRGFINIKDIVNRASKEQFLFDKIDLKALEELATQARIDNNHKNKGDGRILEDTLPVFDCFKVNCGLCVDVCPNRANLRIYDENFDAPYQILHIEDRCNECGNCYTFCTRGGFPYYTKVTLYSTVEDFHNSKNPGFVKIGENKYQLRDEKRNESIYEYNPEQSIEEKSPMEKNVTTIIREYPYLVDYEEREFLR